MNNNEYTEQESGVQGLEGAFARSFGHALAKLLAWAWRFCADRQAVASLLGRYSAHLGVLLLVFFFLLFSRATFAQIGKANTPSTDGRVVAEPLATPTLEGRGGVRVWHSSAAEAGIARQVLPHTMVPDRERLEVITYTLQPGDTIFGVAEYFGLSPYTVVWSNMEILQGAPWLVQPGLTLYIPPVDGAYHTVAADESVESIAETYEVDPVVLYNMWNNLEDGQSLQEGQLLVVPGAVGEDFDWEAPAVAYGVSSASYSSGFCGDINVTGPGANGWFGLPTGSYAVSGWYFGDARNPSHIGLDYRCRLGDPIYASDNGVVVFAGWSGGYGNLVKVDHGNGFVTYYAHLDSIWVGCGEAVYQGSVVGPCGTTGWSTGPHLHYEIRKNGVPQNPQLYEP